MNYLVIENRNEGFFSNFNLIVGSLSSLHDSEIKNFYFQWNNHLYQDDKENLFDKYFYKQNIEAVAVKCPNSNKFKFDKTCTTVELAVHLFSFVTPIEVFKKMNSVLRIYNYFDNEIYKNCNKISAKRPKTLGVHVRGTDHGKHGKLLTLNDYFSKIDEKLNYNYNNLFLATDETKTVKAFTDRYGSLVFTNSEIKRSETAQGIHFSNFTHKEKLATDVITDAISLANCEELIFTASNVAGHVLMLNPDIKHEQIDKHIEFI